MGILHSLFDVNELIVAKLRLYMHGRLHRKATKAKLKRAGGETLTSEELKAATEFWKPYIGGRNMLFHKWYKKSSGTFHRETIPDDIWYSKIDYFFNDKKAGEVIDNKCLYELFFPEAKQAETVAKRINGFWFINGLQLCDINDVILKACDNEAVFLKVAMGSCGGKGVYYITREEMADIIPQISKKINNDIIIQKPIKQHASLARLNASSVNTIRVLSLLSKDGVKVYSVVVRMGIDDAKVDNASSGGISCGVRVGGQLKPVAFSRIGDMYTEHPTTKVKFDDVVIPNYEGIIAQTKMLALKLPMFRMISWDWVIDETETPVLLETNLFNGGISVHQANNSPIFGKDTKMILDEVFQKT